jgi:hypothetical protein
VDKHALFPRNANLDHVRQGIVAPLHHPLDARFVHLMEPVPNAQVIFIFPVVFAIQRVILEEVVQIRANASLHRVKEAFVVQQMDNQLYV